MSPRSPRVTGKELCTMLLKCGFLLKRIEGSHHIFHKPSVSPLVVVPVHGNKHLLPKTLATILKQARLRIEDLKN